MNSAFELVFELLYFFLSLLPESPIASWLDSYVSGDGDVVKVLHYVNYFLPIGSMLEILGLWSAIMGLVWVYFMIRGKFDRG